jgi:hypothetical protein
MHNAGDSASQCGRANMYNADDSVTQCSRDGMYNPGNSAMQYARADGYNAGDSVTPTRCRANSSQSTVSMSNVPEYLWASQLLSPRGLAATSSLFESTKSDESAKVYALRGEDVVTGLGITSLDILNHLVECDDVYEFCHCEEGGGVPIRKGRKGGKKWRRDENDINGDFVTIDHDHLEEDDCSSSDEDNDEDTDEDSDEDTDEDTDEDGDKDTDGIAQGGVSLDVLTPFPKFGESIVPTPS